MSWSWWISIDSGIGCPALIVVLRFAAITSSPLWSWEWFTVATLATVDRHRSGDRLPCFERCFAFCCFSNLVTVSVVSSLKMVMRNDHLQLSQWSWVGSSCSPSVSFYLSTGEGGWPSHIVSSTDG